MENSTISRKARILLMAAFAFLVTFPSARADDLVQNPNARLNFTFQGTQLQKILDEVEQQSDYYFVYNHEQIDVDRRLSIRVENETIGKVLEMLFDGTGVGFEIGGRQITLTPAAMTVPGQQTAAGTQTAAAREGLAQAQGPQGSGEVTRRTVTGRVVNAAGEPLVGVSVYTPELTNGVATDIDGRFSISVAESINVLTFSMIGYQTQELRIPASGTMNVVMKDERQAVSEVIVTGYQTIDPERATGSFSMAPKEMLDNSVDSDLLHKLEGAIPGLYFHNDEFNIRGVATLNGERQPLIVIDGYPSDRIGTVNPRDIANVTVLKDAAAASIYGVRGANGVIVITTHSGRNGKMRIQASSALTIDPIADYSHMNLMNSRELVDFQESLFGAIGDSWTPQTGYASAAAISALVANRDGQLSDSDLNSVLNRLRGWNNQQDVKDRLMQTALRQRHSVSANGGTEVNRYHVSIDYEGGRSNLKGASDNSVTVFFKEEIDLAKWLSLDGAVTTQLYDEKSKNNTAMNFFGYNAMPYNMIVGEDGELTKMYQYKSAAEVERLISVGLYDESSNPVTELDKMNRKVGTTYIRLQGGLTLKPVEGLVIAASYQTERINQQDRYYYEADSYYMKRMMNDATQIIDGEVIRNIPYGGLLSDTRGTTRNYTFRVQANYDHVFGGKHYISALAGAERRSELFSRSSFYKLAYDNNRNLYELLDIRKLLSLAGTQAIGSGNFSYNELAYNNQYDMENRYISFYGNAGYTYEDRYMATFSARVDDTNLFGTNPKYRYLPMWSAGFKWNVTNEAFMDGAVPWLSHLALRATYGITGNVARNTGPYLIASTALNTETGQMGTEILTPPNRSLRWEKTAVFNVGIDAGLFENRVNATLEFYNRNTTDLLANVNSDPTNKFTQVMRNFGSLYNRGFELSVNALALRSGDFAWNTSFNFSYNFNKITKGNEAALSVLDYTDNRSILVEGHSRDALFRFRYAGLNPETGNILINTGRKDEAGNDIIMDYLSDPSLYGDDAVDMLVYSGTTRPKWTLGFINSFTWRSLTLSLHIVANGGHKILDPLPGILTTGQFSLNMDKRAMNFWREPGDEKKAGVMPAPQTSLSGPYGAMWYAADKHVMPGDFLKVRNITLNYRLPREWFGRTVFTEAQLTLQVRNALSWVRNRDGVDPEMLSYSPSNLPTLYTPGRQMPSYMIGLDLTF